MQLVSVYSVEKKKSRKKFSFRPNTNNNFDLMDDVFFKEFLGEFLLPYLKKSKISSLALFQSNADIKDPIFSRELDVKYFSFGVDISILQVLTFGSLDFIGSMLKDVYSHGNQRIIKTQFGQVKVDREEFRDKINFSISIDGELFSFFCVDKFMEKYLHHIGRLFEAIGYCTKKIKLETGKSIFFTFYEEN